MIILAAVLSEPVSITLLFLKYNLEVVYFPSTAVSMDFESGFLIPYFTIPFQVLSLLDLFHSINEILTGRFKSFVFVRDKDVLDERIKQM